jgi:hypothetical protein
VGASAVQQQLVVHHRGQIDLVLRVVASASSSAAGGGGGTRTLRIHGGEELLGG